MIRIATAADLDAIADVHTRARATYYRGHIPEEDYAGPGELARTRQGWQRALARGDGSVLCAEQGGTVAGVAAYRAIDGAMTLTQLHVDPDRWSRGLGGALHGACVEEWRRAGVTAARLEVYEHNLRAQSFYAKHGWRPDPDAPRAPDSAHLALRLGVGRPGERGGTREELVSEFGVSVYVD
ncbi:GNAT family N-acetyltransferase [Streptomyces sp. NPDC051219]|uniref:GNAT family N-acetyltransferase n=1 Tax=Streptomyces sp. NPDC051219 TaxID=3155283 RepID=UPI0034436547